ncbi:Lacal_2735 family protein [Olleya aquimaris]|uniref:Lacal_2735 family protein n=1 Tax=Olleya sediminilitoris TaxID=2795739 RepID=A0ABS1WPD1_9FLAO|nr:MULTISPECIES: Lacal_2735 family protein [Olleya]AXO80015.1 Lacal_2735 family protein [Olleya aquimaris]MBL7560933.1 Lacal_2735 family protein [Olleya sediminilitoris]
MTRRDLLQQHQNKLNKRYKQLVEQAYNLRQTDHEASDVFAYKAIKILDKLNRLSYLARDVSQTAS